MIYYETILGILDPFLAEEKFLVNLTRTPEQFFQRLQNKGSVYSLSLFFLFIFIVTEEVAILAISNRLNRQERVRAAMDANDKDTDDDGFHIDADDSSPPLYTNVDWDNVDFG